MSATWHPAFAAFILPDVAAAQKHDWLHTTGVIKDGLGVVLPVEDAVWLQEHGKLVLHRETAPDTKDGAEPLSVTAAHELVVHTVGGACWLAWRELRSAGYLPIPANMAPATAAPAGFQYHYAVYSPTGYKKSAPGPPLFVMRVMTASTTPDMAQLIKDSKRARLRLAVVDGRTVNFYELGASPTP